MKAKVNETGEIVEVKVHDEFNLDNSPLDYWEKLLHQYAGMAMQGILAKYGIEPLPDDAVHDAYNYAHALVEKMKEVK